MTMTTIRTTELNTGLLFDLIQWAEADERFDAALWGAWDQSAWGWIITEQERKERSNGSCQTAYCMAGQAVHQAGYRLDYDHGDALARNIDMRDGTRYVGPVAVASECIKQRPTGQVNAKGYAVMEDVPGAEKEQIGAVARETLGLDIDEADLFFEGSNEIEQLRQMANLFCASRGLPPLFPNDPVWDTEAHVDDDLDF